MKRSSRLPAVIVMPRSSEPSMSLGSKPWTKSIVLRDARPQLGEGGLVVGVFRHLDAGKSRAAALGVIGRDLHLAGEREHVGREPPAEQDRGVDLALRGVGLGLVEDRGEAAQHLKKAGTDA